jgi:threonine/homoserine/homoserine lactone efflux protein
VLFLIGLAIGFISAIPLGPVNVFVISQTMKRGFRHGFVGGVTACVLDVFYCLIAVLGVTRLTTDYVRYGPVLKIPASFFLAFLAWRLFRHRPETENPKTTVGRISPRAILSVSVMYITNPSLYAFWLAVAGMATSHGWVLRVGPTPILFALCCGLGGSAWYMILTNYVAKHHHQFSPRTFRAIIIGLSAVLFGFAGYTFVSVFF